MEQSREKEVITRSESKLSIILVETEGKEDMIGNGDEIDGGREFTCVINSFWRQYHARGGDGTLLKVNDQGNVSFNGTHPVGNTVFVYNKRKGTFRQGSTPYYLTADGGTLCVQALQGSKPQKNQQFKQMRASDGWHDTLKSKASGLYMLTDDFGDAKMGKLNEASTDRRAWFNVFPWGDTPDGPTNVNNETCSTDGKMVDQNNNNVDQNNLVDQNNNFVEQKNAKEILDAVDGPVDANEVSSELTCSIMEAKKDAPDFINGNSALYVDTAKHTSHMADDNNNMIDQNNNFVDHIKSVDQNNNVGPIDYTANESGCSITAHDYYNADSSDDGEESQKRAGFSRKRKLSSSEACSDKRAKAGSAF